MLFKVQEFDSSISYINLDKVLYIKEIGESYRFVFGDNIWVDVLAKNISSDDFRAMINYGCTGGFLHDIRLELMDIAQSIQNC